jgi:hypothetical protein
MPQLLQGHQVHLAALHGDLHLKQQQLLLHHPPQT